MKRVFFSLVILAAALVPAARSQILIIPPVATVFSVNLSWTNNCYSALTCTFNVYRCTGAISACPITGQTWALLNSTSIAPTVYVDSAITQNTTYSYMVEAVATVSGTLETSGPSNEVAVSVPLAPVAPLLAQPATP